MIIASPRVLSVAASRACAGSVLVIVLWIALGLVTVTLYFANSMTFELRAADNQVAALEADQAIDGATRYVAAVLTTLNTNGMVPDVTAYQSEAVPVGEAHFWLIGRPVDYIVQPDQVFFGLVDEASKLNLNTVDTNMLAALTNMTVELAANIVDWRDTNMTTSANGDGPEIYAQFQPPYLPKCDSFETIDELRLVFRTDMTVLMGEDVNLNGVLDPFEMDTNRNNIADCGLLEYATVYTREPNTRSDGTQKVSVRTVSATSTQLRSLLQTNLTSTRFNQVISALGMNQTPGQGGSNQGPPPPPPQTFPSPLAFYIRSGMTAEEFATISDYITVTNGDYTTGRININTATVYVLACLPGLSMQLAQELVNYRRQNADKLTSIAWLSEALGQNNTAALQTLANKDCITTRSYQYMADVAALGRYGRGYRRVKFIFDTSSGTPKIVYRQDLTHLGWALGTYVRDSWLLAKDTR